RGGGMHAQQWGSTADLCASSVTILLPLPASTQLLADLFGLHSHREGGGGTQDLSALASSTTVLVLWEVHPDALPLFPDCPTPFLRSP
ncbi:unnamed protein product, partial [Closterium sp. Naga37s-1]